MPARVSLVPVFLPPAEAPALPAAPLARPSDDYMGSINAPTRAASPVLEPMEWRAESPKPTKATPPQPLHKAVEDNQLLELTRLLTAGADVHAVNSDGDTVLHIAAKLEDTGAINELLRRGAKLHVRNDKGQTPLEAALAHRAHGTALLLAQEMLRRPMEVTLWPDPAAVAQAFHDTRNLRDTEALDALTRSFNHAEGDLNTYTDLFKYYTHLGSVTGRFGGMPAEGWNFQPMLWQRIRSLCSMIAAAFPTPPPSELTDAATRALLTNMLVGCLRSLHIAEVTQAAAAATTDVQRAATQVLGREIVSMALKLPMGEELTVPLGTTGHAIYAGMRQVNVRGVPVLQCRIDNLGAGARRSHAQDKDSGKVAPLTFNLPVSCLQDNTCYTAFTELVGTLLRDMEDNRVTVKMLYARVLAFAQQVNGDAGVLESIDPVASHAAQWAGNCTLKNHTAALGAQFTHAARTQLGADATQDTVADLGTRLLRWFKDCERRLVIQRIQDAVTPTKLWQHYKDETLLRLADLLDNQEVRKSGRLEHFFAKDGRDQLASKLTARQLADVVRCGDVKAMRLLMTKGVDLRVTNVYGQTTLLHQAVRSGNATMVQLLLEAGIDATAEDGEHHTAAALARELGSGTVLATLILHGKASADADTERTLRGHLAVLQQAIDKLNTLTPVAASPDTSAPAPTAPPPVAPWPLPMAVTERQDTEDVEMKDVAMEDVEMEDAFLV